MTLDLSLPALGSIDSYDRYMQSIRAIPSLTAEEEMSELKGTFVEPVNIRHSEDE